MLLKRESRSVVSRSLKSLAEHPFLAVRKDEYAALQARAEQWPWNEQKAAAIHETLTVRYYPEARIDVRGIVLAGIFSTTALAYILDPANRPRYVARIVEHLQAFDPAAPGSITAEMLAQPDKTIWRYGVPTSNAFFQGVLALDIIHDELAPTQLERIEAMLRDGPARYFHDVDLAWKQGTFAARAIWPLYERDEKAYGPVVEAWHRDTLHSISPDGVFRGGTAYADARWSFTDREHKGMFGEVLAHAGVLPDWYADPRLANFHEWLNGYAFTPFRLLWSFGDAGPDKFNGVYQPGSERAYRYSAKAAGYAAWLRDDLTPPATLASYVFAEKPPAPPLAPPSRVFPDGGAWLKETSVSNESLCGALWNLAAHRDAHAHKETNSLCISAYGEMLLRGGGYNGWATPEAGFSWTYIHDRAIAANTVLFDYAIPSTDAQEKMPTAVNDHAKPHGAGITASLLTGAIDFARGDSGDAIPNGRHVRNLLFIHPRDGAAGYFVTIDELSATPGATAHVVWHPASADYVETIANRQYTWTTSEFSGQAVGLTIGLATPPRDVAIRNGMLANWGNGVIGKYLVGNYPIGAGGTRRVVTLLFPHDAGHPNADIAAFDGEAFSGAMVRQGDVIDRAFESDGVGPIDLDGVSAIARAGCLRRIGDAALASVWLMDATAFNSPAFGFESDAAVTLFVAGDEVQICTTADTTIRIRRPNLAGVSVGDSAFPLADEAHVVAVLLTAGTHTLRLRDAT